MDDEANEQKDRMEEGGFTIVSAAAVDENAHGKKGKGCDGLNTV